MATHYLAVDLGAESGRVMLGTLVDGRLSLEEIHRFENIPVRVEGSLHWDVPKLFEGIKAGLAKVVARGLGIASISCDAWGVDYVLVSADGTLMAPAFHYRDPRTSRGVETVLARVPWEVIFSETGVQYLPFNTLFQLGAELPGRLAQAGLVLPMGDVFNYLLSGVARAEVSLASTTQLYNPQSKRWSELLLRAVGLTPRSMPEIVPSGTRLGPLKAELFSVTGHAQPEVIATCSHDTGAAVAAVPVGLSDEVPTWAYLSSGTWSLLGVEVATPVVTEACRELNFTNEIGYGDSVRLLKNIVGLWIVQECRRGWIAEGKSYDYGTLTELAAGAPAFRSLINPADPRFLAPGAMAERIAAYCSETGQPIPSGPGATVRCVLESLALLYRRVVGEAGRLWGRPIERLHVVGGGSQNRLLNQFTANALQIPVWTGPIEATAIGNVMIQAMALGHVATWAAARHMVKDSFALQSYQASDRAAWEEAYARFERLAGLGAER